MAKYIIDIPEQIAEASTDYMKKVGMSIEPYTEPDRKAIEDAQEEAWSLAKKIILTVPSGGLTIDEIKDCFGNPKYFADVLKDFSYQEAKAKYDAWKKKKNKIHVGDEVKHKQCEWEAFVTNISESGYLTLMWDLGEASSGFDPENFEKTGKHCAEIEELIKKINEVQHNE